MRGSEGVEGEEGAGEGEGGSAEWFNNERSCVRSFNEPRERSSSKHNSNRCISSMTRYRKFRLELPSTGEW